ncbi:flagellar basal body rod protein FlgB [Acidobacteria bacterium AB60]|nr:flagellar basal body rod protein FlgB [Acidobacteria bacterium AB60]
MQIDTLTSDEIGRYLDLTAQATKLAAQNVANIDTPGYRSLGIDFESEMRKEIGRAESKGGPDGKQTAQVRFEDGLVARPDGNNVSMDRESLNLALAQLRFKTGIAVLRRQYQMIADAIRADGK